jgi:hypothetical protein
MWQTKAILTIRNLIGDLEGVSYTDLRISQLFVISASLVLFDTSFSENYVVDVSAVSITPDPENDNDFMGLVCLRAACVLLSSELRSRGISTNKVTMKDGPSEITMDNSSSMTSLKDLSTSACKKYEDALFQFRAGNSIGVAILGPYSPGSVSAGRNTESDNSRNTYY